VGTGIALAGHLTLEARARIVQAQKVLSLLGEPVMEEWIRELNPTAETLVNCYAHGKPRARSYEEMVERILSHVRRGLDVVVAIYGHPAVMCDPTRAALRAARREGYRTRLLPGISAEDCLFADLGIDPGDRGLQSYEATDFLNRSPRIETTSALILWQIGVIGESSVVTTSNVEGLRCLATALARRYPRTHRVVIYEAPCYPVFEPIIRHVPLRLLPESAVPVIATLYVPPLRRRRVEGEIG
jgi:uncharacterized protein YabN with tetrapyrrole methylase and pyrophosphatase domain